MFTSSQVSRNRSASQRSLLAAIAIAVAAPAAIADVRYIYQPDVEPADTSTYCVIAITDAAYLARAVASVDDVTWFTFTSEPGVGLSSLNFVTTCAFQLSADRTKIDSGGFAKSFFSTVSFTFGHAANTDLWSYSSFISGLNLAGSGEFVVAGPDDFARTYPEPAGIANSLTPRFLWNSSHTAATYSLSIAGDVGMTNIIHTATHLTETGYTVPRGVLAAGVQYYWQVSATNLVGTTAAIDSAGTSGPGLFVIGLPLGEAGECAADFNNSGAVTVQDIFDFLAAYFAGCP